MGRESGVGDAEDGKCVEERIDTPKDGYKSHSSVGEVSALYSSGTQ